MAQTVFPAITRGVEAIADLFDDFGPAINALEASKDNGSLIPTYAAGAFPASSSPTRNRLAFESDVRRRLMKDSGGGWFPTMPYLVVHDFAPGGDLGAQINAADVALGATYGELWVIVPSTAAAPMTTAVTISAGHTLRFFPGNFYHNVPSGPAFTISGAAAGIIGSGAVMTALTNLATAAGTTSISIVGSSSQFVRDIMVKRNALPAAGSGANGLVITSTVTFTLHTVFEGLYINNHDVGLLLGPSSIGHVDRVFVETCAGHGVHLTNNATQFALQWHLNRVMSQLNGGDGFRAASVAVAGGSNPMGTWTDLKTYANSGYGMAFLGLAATPINGIRIRSCFVGEDAKSEIYLDTYGGQHSIQAPVIEIPGSGNTGPAHATPPPSPAVAHGIEITTNNNDITIGDPDILNAALDGINTAAANTAITGGKVMGSGTNVVAGYRNGIRFRAPTAPTAPGGGVVTGVLTGNSTGGANQQIGVMIDIDDVVVVGNRLPGNTVAPVSNSVPLVNSQIVGNDPPGAGDTILGRHLMSPTGTVPVLTGGAGAGSAPVVTLTAGSTDTAGQIIVTTGGGTAPTASGTIATLSFAAAYTRVPRVQLTPANQTAAALSGNSAIYVAEAVTYFLLTAGLTALPTGQTYIWNYHAIGSGT